MSDAGFLGRWSRRKRAALAEPVPPPAATPATAPAIVPAPEAPPAAAFDPASLPPVDTLTAASEVRDFLRAGVPAALRQAALRRVWALDPAIAGFVGPADYAWDFNAPDGMPGFAPAMPSDMGQMLARAIGLEKPERATSEAQPGAGPTAEPTAAEPPGADPPDTGLRLAVPSIVAGEATPAESAPTADAPPTLPKRHGAATPV